jgi:hypothetical protein
MRPDTRQRDPKTSIKLGSSRSTSGSTISNRRSLGNAPGQHFSSPSLISSFGLRVKRSRRNVMCCSGIWDQKRSFRTQCGSQPAWPTPTSHIPDCRRAQFQNPPRRSVWMTVSVEHKQSIRPRQPSPGLFLWSLLKACALSILCDCTHLPGHEFVVAVIINFAQRLLS